MPLEARNPIRQFAPLLKHGADFPGRASRFGNVFGGQGRVRALPDQSDRGQAIEPGDFARDDHDEGENRRRQQQRGRPAEPILPAQQSQEGILDPNQKGEEEKPADGAQEDASPVAPHADDLRDICNLAGRAGRGSKRSLSRWSLSSGCGLRLWSLGLWGRLDPWRRLDSGRRNWRLARRGLGRGASFGGGGGASIKRGSSRVKATGGLPLGAPFMIVCHRSESSKLDRAGYAGGARFARIQGRSASAAENG